MGCNMLGLKCKICKKTVGLRPYTEIVCGDCEKGLIYETFTNASPIIKMRISHPRYGLLAEGEGKSYFRLKNELLHRCLNIKKKYPHLCGKCGKLKKNSLGICNFTRSTDEMCACHNAPERPSAAPGVL